MAGEMIGGVFPNVGFSNMSNPFFQIHFSATDGAGNAVPMAVVLPNFRVTSTDGLSAYAVPLGGVAR